MKKNKYIFKIIGFITIVFFLGNTQVTQALIFKELKNSKAINFRIEERKMWSDYSRYLREYVLSVANETEDESLILEKLIQNQEKIALSLKPYYGNYNSNKLSELLKEQIYITSKILHETKNNNNKDVEQINKLKNENSEKIARFLYGINELWKIDLLEEILNKHLNLVCNQINSRINGQWERDIKAYDDDYDHIIMFSDLISDGIIKEFPNKFGKQLM